MTTAKEVLYLLSERETVEVLVSKYINLPLECDGLTRVIHYILDRNKIKHKVFLGSISLGDKNMDPHYWIELSDKRIVDYRARMWLGNKKEAPHGVFKLKDHPDVKYSGKIIRLSVSDTIFQILTLGV